MLFVLEYDGNARLAAVHKGKVIKSETKPIAEWALSLAGLDLDAVWEHIIVTIGDVTIAEGKTLDEQLAENDQREKLLRQIEKLEKQARNEKQPRRKWELAEEMRKIKRDMN